VPQGANSGNENDSSTVLHTDRANHQANGRKVAGYSMIGYWLWYLRPVLFPATCFDKENSVNDLSFVMVGFSLTLLGLLLTVREFRRMSQ
jgi:hypothetical protein